MEQYGIGISMGLHRGNVNIIRSYVYGDDTHTTVTLSGFDKFYGSKSNEVWVVASRKVIEDFHTLLEQDQCQEMDGSRLTQEKLRVVFQQQGAYRLLLQ